MTQNRWRGLASLVAVAVIVVGLVSLLVAHNLGGAHHGGPGAHSQGTVSTTATLAPGTPGTSGATGETLYPVIAPSNPQIVYSIVGAAANSIARSIDGGRTYTQVATPPTTLPSATFVVTVSPLDANHLIATATGQRAVSPTNCVNATTPAATLGAAQQPLADTLSGYSPCSQGFFSANGGATWRALSLPNHDVIGSTAVLRLGSSVFAPTQTLLAQGTRLYAAIGQSSSYGVLVGGPVQVVVSDDDGATWQLVSNGLGSQICDFAPAPTGETVYAIVAATACNNESPSALTLWRSDNAGSSWTQVSDLPTKNEAGMAVTASGALYIEVAQTVTSSPSPSSVMIVSVNGGATFADAPMAGAPTSANYAGPLGALSDGSILVTTDQSNAQGDQRALYAWQAGDARWRQVGPKQSGVIVEVIVVAHGTQDVIYVVTGSGIISHFTV